MQNCKIKICGLTKIEEAEYLNYIHSDFAGMVVFFPKSKRNITIDTAKEIMPKLDSSIKKVAVCVSPTCDQVDIMCDAGFDYIQIHGDMPDELISRCTLPIIRAFNISNMSEVEKLKDNEKIAGFLYDAVTPGSGKVFDWNLIPELKVEGKMIILAGGLNSENVKEAIEKVKPDAVDVSSSVEFDVSENKLGKDRNKVIAFANAVRNA